MSWDDWENASSEFFQVLILYSSCLLFSSDHSLLIPHLGCWSLCHPFTVVHPSMVILISSLLSSGSTCGRLSDYKEKKREREFSRQLKWQWGKWWRVLHYSACYIVFCCITLELNPLYVVISDFFSQTLLVTLNITQRCKVKCRGKIYPAFFVLGGFSHCGNKEIAN
jgi:hypothetical protein